MTRTSAALMDVGTESGPWITWRSALIGTAAVGLVCGIAPYNDYVVANTWLTGSYFPPALILTFFVLVVLINAPLLRFKPRWALTQGELGVVMVMLLMGCGIPGQGLFRQLIPTMVAPAHFVSSDAVFARAFGKMKLPPWLFATTDPNDPVVRDFYGRVQPGAAIPYGAWVRPLIAWGIFVLGMWLTLISLAVLVWRQWVINERLAFPIAQLEAGLIESPKRGRMLNDLLGSRVFWIAAGLVIVLRSLAAMHEYQPRYFPELPLGYDFTKLMGNDPWAHMEDLIKKNSIYFTFIGMSYLMQTRVSFSLWATVLIRDIIIMQTRRVGAEIPKEAWADQHLGACAAFLLGILWIGRHHWARVIRSALRGTAEDGVNYRRPMGMMIAGVGIMFGWLLIVGATWWVGIAIIGFILMVHLVIARVIAETGFPFIRVYANFGQIYNNLKPSLFSGRDIYLTNAFHLNGGAVVTRESPLAFATHGFYVTQASGMKEPERRKIVGLIAWVMAFGFVIAAWSSLHYYYTYATPIAPGTTEPYVNSWSVEDMPKTNLVEPVDRYEEGKFNAPRHSYLNFGIGAGITILLQTMSLRYAAWPLVPIGYLASATGYSIQAFSSLFLGWAAKVLILKMGGARLFQQARPFFVGLIFGEALAAAAWLLITLLLASGGYTYKAILMLPN